LSVIDNRVKIICVSKKTSRFLALQTVDGNQMIRLQGVWNRIAEFILDTLSTGVLRIIRITQRRNAYQHASLEVIMIEEAAYDEI
jgi:hypothetical protein